MSRYEPSAELERLAATTRERIATRKAAERAINANFDAIAAAIEADHHEPYDKMVDAWQRLDSP